MITGHGNDSYRYSHPIRYDFSSNIGGGVDLSSLKEHIATHLNLIETYPQPAPITLEKELAKSLSIDPACVCVTSGAVEAVYLVAQTWAGSSSAIVAPTFMEYEDACRMNRHALKRIASPDELGDSPQLVWLCNPNNPTGKVIERAFLTALLRSHPHILFVIDRSYENFTMEPQMGVGEALALPNVIQIHSMTKRYAIPGLRLGYMTGCAALVDRVRSFTRPWSVNSLAIEAALYLLSHPCDIDIESCLHEAQRLQGRLRGLGEKLEVMPTCTHFMLARLRERRACDLKEYLIKQHGLLIRDASNFAGLDEHFFRVAAQTVQADDILVNAIDEWLRKS